MLMYFNMNSCAKPLDPNLQAFAYLYKYGEQFVTWKPSAYNDVSTPCKLYSLRCL